MRGEHVKDMRADPSAMTGQCETKPLAPTPALVYDSAWQEGNTHLIVTGRHGNMAKSPGLSVKDLADNCVHELEV